LVPPEGAGGQGLHSADALVTALGHKPIPGLNNGNANIHRSLDVERSLAGESLLLHVGNPLPFDEDHLNISMTMRNVGSLAQTQPIMSPLSKVLDEADIRAAQRSAEAARRPASGGIARKSSGLVEKEREQGREHERLSRGEDALQSFVDNTVKTSLNSRGNTGDRDKQRDERKPTPRQAMTPEAATTRRPPSGSSAYRPPSSGAPSLQAQDRPITSAGRKHSHKGRSVGTDRHRIDHISCLEKI
jgi:hypothetical protein